MKPDLITKLLIVFDLYLGLVALGFFVFINSGSNVLINLISLSPMANGLGFYGTEEVLAIPAGVTVLTFVLAIIEAVKLKKGGKRISNFVKINFAIPFLLYGLVFLTLAVAYSRM